MLMATIASIIINLNDMNKTEMLEWARSLQEKYYEAKGYNGLMLLVDEMADFVDEFINQNNEK